MAEEKNKLMMAGSNLIQVGGMLILGPCENSERLCILVMVGDVPATEFLAGFKENADGYEIIDTYLPERDSNKIFYMGGVSFNEFPLDTPDHHWGYIPRYSGELGYVHRTSFPAVSLATDPMDSLYEERDVGLASGIKADAEVFVRAIVGMRTEYLNPNTGEVQYRSITQASIQRRVSVTMPAPNVDDVPPDTDLEFHGKSFWLAVDEGFSPVPSGANQYVGSSEDWYLTNFLLPGWDPGLAGNTPRLAVARVDESGKIKEIVWQSK